MAKTQMYRNDVLSNTQVNLYPVTEAKYVTMNDGQTVEEMMSNLDTDKYTPVIESSKAMFKVGEGDSVDLSESAIDGAYNSCVLKGKTLVNCIQESSSQDVVLPYEFEDGQYATINDTKESGALGVELKGQTLVNLAENSTAYAVGSDSGNNRKVTKDGKSTKVEIVNKEVSCVVVFDSNYQLKANTKYTITFDSITTGFENTMAIGFHSNEGNYAISTKVITTNNGKNKIVLSTPSESEIVGITVGSHGIIPIGSTIQISNMIVLEGDYTNIDIPYFEGMASCKMPILSTVGKNLFNYKNYNLKVNEGQNPQEIIVDEQGLSFNVDTASWKSLWYDLYLESGEKYTLSYNTNLLRCFIFKSKVNTYVSSEFVADTTVINATEDKIQKVTKTFTAPSTGFIRVRLTSENKAGSHILQNFQIEKSSSVTTYEPHKSSILSTPSDLVLGSVGGVQDILDVNTGKLVQRTELIDGNYQYWAKNDYVPGEKTSYFYTNNIAFKPNSTVISNKVPHERDLYAKDVFGCKIGGEAAKYLEVRVEKTKLETDDVAGFIKYLKDNDIVFRANLDKEVTKTVDLKVVDQNGNVIPTLKSWNTTTHIYSEIPENSLYPILSHSNPTYPVILNNLSSYLKA